MKRILLLAVLCACSMLVAADELARQRALFDVKYREVLKGATPRAETLAALRGYPLTPWLVYHALKRKLRALPVAEVRRFLATDPESLPAARLRTDWLRETARQGRFDLFRQDYTPQADPELRCRALSDSLAEQSPPRALKPALELWLTGKSQAPACDAVFGVLRDRGLLTDALVWQRILLAAEAGNTPLAVAIARRYGDDSQRTMAELLHTVHGTPSRTPALVAGRPDSAMLRDVIAQGLARLARHSLKAASASWQSLRPRYAFAPEQAGRVQRALAIAAVTTENPARLEYLREVADAGVDDTVERYRLREGLRARAWPDLVRWTAGAPRGATTNALRWRYWQARALEETGQRDAAQQAFRALATERDYYGFLACDRVGLPYAMTHKAIHPSGEERARLGSTGGLQRAQEFHRLKRLTEARAEIAFELEGRNQREREVGAALVFDWGWHAEAILMLGQMQSYDDLELRFPLLHRDLVTRLARARGIPPALVFAIIRGESAFVADARSAVGALGLMQVMPATARATARGLGLRLRSDLELVQADKNIAIGSEYLRQVLRQFGGHFPLAAAAYNAGPSRVKAWLKGVGCTPEDVWVDTLPFLETEGYVRRALFYAAVYEWRLGVTVSPLAARMAGMTKFGATDVSC